MELKRGVRVYRCTDPLKKFLNNSNLTLFMNFIGNSAYTPRCTAYTGDALTKIRESTGYPAVVLSRTRQPHHHRLRRRSPYYRFAALRLAGEVRPAEPASNAAEGGVRKC